MCVLVMKEKKTEVSICSAFSVQICEEKPETMKTKFAVKMNFTACNISMPSMPNVEYAPCLNSLSH